jgi:hypothetical protein
MKSGGGKGKAYIFIAQNGRYLPYCIQIVALRALFSLHILEHVHSIYEHYVPVLHDLHDINPSISYLELTVQYSHGPFYPMALPPTLL